MAPEIVKGSGYSVNSDLWTLVICIYEFLCGFIPYGKDI